MKRGLSKNEQIDEQFASVKRKKHIQIPEFSEEFEQKCGKTGPCHQKDIETRDATPKTEMTPALAKSFLACINFKNTENCNYQATDRSSTHAQMKDQSLSKILSSQLQPKFIKDQIKSDHKGKIQKKLGPKILLANNLPQSPQAKLGQAEEEDFDQCLYGFTEQFKSEAKRGSSATGRFGNFSKLLYSKTGFEDTDHEIEGETKKNYQKLGKRLTRFMDGDYDAVELMLKTLRRDVKDRGRFASFEDLGKVSFGGES